MDPLPYANITKGTFLIAAPEIDSGLFFRAVVLLCEHNANGSFGLIVNKSIDLEIPEDLLNMNQIANPHIHICAGGPVEPNQMMLLHSCGNNAEHTLKITDEVYLGGDLHFLQEAVSNPNGPRIKLCFGYSGWSAGQLEREFLDGGWFLCQASHYHLFHSPMEKLWQLLLREMGGKYASLSMIPEDLSLN